ncbi:hypothetical protein SAY86_003519 [Trapa natans]|uniref:DDHD domain-containing protein n=1 Tax=Trapa natans TaxID=22666 RepID=A0AAN7RH05_TRANT|nr:hypothetical protein SAY86_003519 [Trapa natans]
MDGDGKGKDWDVNSASSGIQETSPDLLRNTPSNIARLEDVIEHCKGRQKYHAQTRSPWDGSDVRWYFCKVPLAENELAAAIPHTEIVGKSEYFRFGMRDSLAIEASFLQREEELLSEWWKEFAECSDGPGTRISAFSCKDSGSHADQLAQYRKNEEERVGVPVKGGLYEVDLVRRHCYPIYWQDENRRVLRGHWFALKVKLEWLPLREDVAEQLEFAYRSQVWHRRTFQPSGLYAARVDLQGSTPGLHALFTGEDDTWEAWLNVDSSGFSSVIGITGSGIKIRRGYSPSLSHKPTKEELRQQKEEEMDDYCSQVPVRHLVFMVHGIGQRLENANLVDDVGSFRNITTNLAEHHLSPYQRGAQRVLFIPCQWRKGLKLSGEAAVEKITLDGVRGLRNTLSATVHDVLYYMSPIYCQKIIDSVSYQLNRLYLKFLKRNPGYDGKVSLYGHSLGSVLSYDILCHQDTLSTSSPMDLVYQQPKDHTDSVGNNENSCTSSPVTSSAHEVVASDVTGENKPLAPSSSREEKEPTKCSSAGHCTKNVGDKEEEINSLRKENYLLRAKVAELESHSHRRDVGEVLHPEMRVKESCLTSEPLYGKGGHMKSYTPLIKYTKLEFKVDTYFAVGSPLGVFLALRNIRIGIGKGKVYWAEENISEEIPACQQMFNIFHPFDPVAYRVEPLVCKEYISKRPVIIPYHKGRKRLHIGFQEFTENLAARSQAIMENLSSLGAKLLSICQSREMENLDEAAEDGDGKHERSYGSLMMERLTGTEQGRVDHILQSKTFEHPIISSLGAHTNYWRDYDTALFILKHLYREIPEDPSLLSPERSLEQGLLAGATGEKRQLKKSFH